MRNSTILACIAFLSTCWASFGQAGQLVKPGPMGRPSLVLDEGEEENWNPPIQVYSDRDIALYVSDQLTLAGIYWDGPRFKKEGKFQTYIYSFYKTDHDCRVQRVPKGHEADPDWLEACADLRYNRRLVTVDANLKTLTVLQSALIKSDGFFHPDLVVNKPIVIPLDGKVNPALTEAVQRIIQLLRAELSRHSDIK
jgi:hypothetical protein